MSDGRSYVRPTKRVDDMTREAVSEWSAEIWAAFTRHEAESPGEGDTAGAASGENGGNPEELDD